MTLYLMCGLLLVGFLCNLAMHPVDERHHFKPAGIPPATGTRGKK